MTKSKPKKSTYDKIIDDSLMLFNAEGERKITTNHIAAHLNISPGNLYYHFSNKDEIIFQLFKRYSSKIIDLLEKSHTLTNPAELSRFIGKIFDIMWEYRFFFTDVNSLLSRNTELKGEHEKFTLDQISPLIVRYLTEMSRLGMVDMNQADMEIFTINFWIVIKYWFVFDKSIHNNQLNIHSKERGIKQILGMLRPYLEKQYREEFDQLLSTLNTK